MSLQERTLVIKNFDPERTTFKLLKELCLQGGPVRNVVVKSDHAFVEFEDVESVGYSKALFDGIEMFGKKLHMEPKIKTDQSYYKYSQKLLDYVIYDRQQQAVQHQAQQSQQIQFNQQNQQFVAITPTPRANVTNDPQIFNPGMSLYSSMPNLNYPSVFPTQNFAWAGQQLAAASNYMDNQNLDRSRSFNNRNNYKGQGQNYNNNKDNSNSNYRRQSDRGNEYWRRRKWHLGTL